MLYELTCLISPDLNENEVAEFAEKLLKLLSESGKIIKTENPKKIRLSYKIEKQTNAFMLSFIFEADPDKLASLKVNLDKDKSVIRFLLIKTKIEEERKIPDKREQKTPESAKPEKIKTTRQAKDDKKEIKIDKKSKKVEDKATMEKIEEDLDKILDSPSDEKL
ncbi:MAG: 30S ribosomal protein S6 [Parcubacteria group bacterium]|nr:30S ribosomal protein S6 [Parcubacteria group bacterium]